MLVDLNRRSGFVYGRSADASAPLGARINAAVDAALVAERADQRPRDYLGASRIGEPCARRLVYEVTHTPPDPGKDFEGRSLRIFAAGHVFEDLAIRWLRQARFDLRTHTQAVPFDPAAAQALSDRAVDVLRAADAGDLLPRIATSSDFFLCRSCPFSARCWEDRA